MYIIIIVYRRRVVNVEPVCMSHRDDCSKKSIKKNHIPRTLHIQVRYERRRVQCHLNIEIYNVPTHYKYV